MKRKVLIVDDDRLILEMLTFGLQRANMETKTASNGVEALQIAWDFQPDIIVMDIMMPMIDGMEAASVLKNHPRTGKIPIIFISGKGSPSPPDGTAGLAEAYVQKPFRLEDLVSHIRSVLEERESLDQEVKEDKDFFGKLSLINLPDLLQILEQGRNTGALTLTTEGKKGVVYFQEGRILDATVGKRRGKSAFYQLSAWDKGDFSFRSEPVSTPPAIEAPAMELVLEGMRRLDERRHLLSELPDLRSVLRIKPEMKKKLGSKKLSPELESFLELFNGKRTLEEIVDLGGEDEIDTLRQITKLHSAGLLQEKPAGEGETSVA